MLIIPAIDLLGGKVVRLRQGSFDTAVQYSSEPEVVASQFEAAGAKWLHVVDLDGAKEGAPQNVQALHQIISSVNIPVQFGGGVRLMHTAEMVLGLGVTRVVLGSVLTKSERIAAFFFEKLGDSAVAGIDARGGIVAVNGWQQQTELNAVDFARLLAGLGCRRIVYTDIDRDGLLGGADIDRTRSLAQAAGVPVIAGGGVSSLKDLRNLAALRAVGVEGAIVGKAAYENASEFASWLKLDWE